MVWDGTNSRTRPISRPILLRFHPERGTGPTPQNPSRPIPWGGPDPHHKSFRFCRNPLGLIDVQTALILLLALLQSSVRGVESRVEPYLSYVANCRVVYVEHSIRLNFRYSGVFPSPLLLFSKARLLSPTSCRAKVCPLT
jgi:hypothetical protein